MTLQPAAISFRTCCCRAVKSDWLGESFGSAKRLADKTADKNSKARIAPARTGLSQLKAQGNAKAGRDLLQSYGCGSCHTLPGLGKPAFGPPLTRFAERQYIAGSLVNVPSNAVAWITNPQQLKPKTAMPNLNVKPAEALDIAAYLYTSGNPERLTALERIVGMSKASTRR